MHPITKTHRAILLAAVANGGKLAKANKALAGLFYICRGLDGGWVVTSKGRAAATQAGNTVPTYANRWHGLHMPRAS